MRTYRKTHICSYRQLLLLIAIAAFFGACSRKPVWEQTDERDSAVMDTIEAVTEPEEPVKSELSFQTASEAIEYMRSSLDSERYMAGILPTMANDELSYCTKLLNSEHPHFFIVDKAELEIVVYDRFGREEKRVGMACSKNYGTKHKFRDNRTPEGFFTAKKVYNSTDWLYTDDDGNTSDKEGQFGPRFIRLNIPGTSQIGIHGTCAPWSIGHRRSHGCIRVTNDHIMELVEYVDSGMPVIVSPGSRDMAVNEEEGYYVPSVSTRPGGSKASARKYRERGQRPAETSEPSANDSVETSIHTQETQHHAHPDTLVSE